jgi:hypothetical protein
MNYTGTYGAQDCPRSYAIDENGMFVLHADHLKSVNALEARIEFLEKALGQAVDGYKISWILNQLRRDWLNENDDARVWEKKFYENTQKFSDTELSSHIEATYLTDKKEQYGTEIHSST